MENLGESEPATDLAGWALESLNHQTHCRKVQFWILVFTIQGFSERGAGKEGGTGPGSRFVARNPGDGLRRASLALMPFGNSIHQRQNSSGWQGDAAGYSPGGAVDLSPGRQPWDRSSTTLIEAPEGRKRWWPH